MQTKTRSEMKSERDFCVLAANFGMLSLEKSMQVDIL